MIKNIIKGIKSYGDAVSHISKHGMWGYVLLPGLLSLILGALLVTASWGWSDDLGGLIGSFWKWEWGKTTIEKIAEVFGGLLILFFGAIIFKQILMVVLAPFMSLLSEKVERQLTGGGDVQGFTIRKAVYEMSRGLRIAVRNIVREMLVTIFLFLLGLFPLFTPFTTILIFLTQSYYAGFGNMDYTLERHYKYRESVKFVRNNRSLALGNGIIFMLLFLSVVGFVFALPLGTVAATLQTVDRIESKFNNKMEEMV